MTTSPSVRALSLRTDVIVGALILAFTALPTSMRALRPQVLENALGLDFYLFDAVANIVGYVPLGMVLSRHGWRWALPLGVLLSGSAELAQIFCVGRSPGIVDVATNAAGTAIGLLVASRVRLLPDRIHVTLGGSILAALAVLTFVSSGGAITAEAPLQQLRSWIKAPPWMKTNAVGGDQSGRVEILLPFEQVAELATPDVSVNALPARTVRAPRLVAGAKGMALSVDARQWVDLGSPVALRITGSMTLSAWVRAARFPGNDAAIISSLTDNELGYQLDLTVDQGARAIGFKIASASGRLVSRYGRTPLVADRWYHVAGVYDAKARTLDVYLDGINDNGCLTGTVTERQRPSGGRVTVGRRAGLGGSGFIGVIDEPQIASRALEPAEIHDQASTAPSINRAGSPEPPRRLDQYSGGESSCRNLVRPARVAGPFAMLGMLIALACGGRWSRGRLNVTVCALCLLAGSTAVLWSSVVATFQYWWQAPLYVVLGGMSVLIAREANGWLSAEGTR